MFFTCLPTSTSSVLTSLVSVGLIPLTFAPELSLCCPANFCFSSSTLESSSLAKRGEGSPNLCPGGNSWAISGLLSKNKYLKTF